MRFLQPAGRAPPGDAAARRARRAGGESLRLRRAARARAPCRPGRPRRGSACTTRRRLRRAGCRPRGGAASLAAVHPRDRAGRGWPLRLSARVSRRKCELLARARVGPRRRGARRRDRAAGPSAALAQVARRHVRRDRDRGGAAAACPRAERRRAPRHLRAGPRGAGDGRAGGRGNARGPVSPARLDGAVELPGRAGADTWTSARSSAAARSCCAWAGR